MRALYAFGEHDALGFSPFSIEDAPLPPQDYPLARSYGLIRQLMPLICAYRGSDDMRGVLFSQEDASDTLAFGDTRLLCSHFFTLPWDPRATDGSVWPEGGAVVISLAPDEFLIAGSGVVVEIRHEDELPTLAPASALGEDGFVRTGSSAAAPEREWRKGAERLGIGFVDEVRVAPDGSLESVRRLGGDQSHQGRHARIGVDDYSILHVKLYRYR